MSNDADLRRGLIAQHDRARERLKQAKLSMSSQQHTVVRLEELQARPSFLKRPSQKMARHIRRLARARTELRTRVEEAGTLEAEVQRLDSRLAG
jgi:predicted RNase H-like nuclease (RuvC/YqgF family)